MATESAKPTSPAGPRRPYHLGVSVGLSTGFYALTLAGVTSAQVSHDRAVIDDRRPTQDAIRLLGSSHELMLARLAAARVRFELASARFEGATERLRALQSELARLAAAVAEIEGTAFALPDRIALPGVPKIKAVSSSSTTTAPATTGTTGASGTPP